MNLGKLKSYFEKFEDNKVFQYALSQPFSWRGSYDEVAFDVIEKESTTKENLEKINLALTETFHGYKGGMYNYDTYTTVHFEESVSRYTDGQYCLELISKISKSKPYRSPQDMLIQTAFANPDKTHPH